MTQADSLFEESLARLEKIVDCLQRDDVPLDEAGASYKRRRLNDEPLRSNRRR